MNNNIDKNKEKGMNIFMKKTMEILGGVLLLTGISASCVVFANNTGIKSNNSSLDSVTDNYRSTSETVDITNDVSDPEVKVSNFGNVTFEYNVSEGSESVVEKNAINADNIGQGGQEAIDADR